MPTPTPGMRVPAKPRRRVESNMVIETFVPGAYYQGVTVGGFTDSATGIHVPGPHAIIDETNKKRDIVGLTDLPDPVQLPTHKIVLVVSESGKKREEKKMSFDGQDEQPIHDGFILALQTGLIRIVSDEDVQEKYPAAWDKFEPEIVWYAENVRPKKSMLELLQEAETAGRLVNASKALTKAVRARTVAVTGEEPPPPPPE